MPTDVGMPNQEKIDEILEIMVKSQYFYCEEMDRLGFGPLTFDFDEDIQIVKGKLKVREYIGMEQILDDVPALELAVPHTVQVVFLGGAFQFMAGAFAHMICFLPFVIENACTHTAVIPTRGNLVLPFAAHEIGHTLWLRHIENPKLIMNPLFVNRGFKVNNLNDYELSMESAKQLSENPLITPHPDLLKEEPPEILVLEIPEEKPPQPKEESLSVVARYKIRFLWANLKKRR